MLRRLPLLGTATPETPALSAVRTPLGAGSIGIVDTDTGELAASFACALAIAFVALAAHVRLTVLGYQGVPVLDAGLVAGLTAHGITPALWQVADDGSFGPRGEEVLRRADARAQVGLFVGYPALGACRPALSLLLGADRSLSAWPPVLRGVRGDFALALAAPRAGLAPLLATALIERGFLPRG
ncbi:MAG: hypothetical protein RLZZ450_2794 [Pseudomonadota bacterium]|jgi:hypothetical protein